MKASAEPTDPFKQLLREQGSIGRAILEKDWSATSLGPIADWPVSLKTLLRMTLTTRQPIVFFWGPDLHQFFNEPYAPILNGMPPDPIGAPFKIYWQEVFEGVRPFFERTMRGESCGAQDLPLTLTRNGVTEETFWSFFYSPLHDDDGEIAGFLNIVHETTAAVLNHRSVTEAGEALAEENRKTKAALASREKAERRQQVLQRELSHRMKNSLAMVQAIVSQSMRHAASLEEAGQSIVARVQALGRAQDILTRTSWERTDVYNVVEAALSPHRDSAGDRRVILSGPSVEVIAEQGLGLSLAIHELATNATKYGALAREDGEVLVEWSQSGNDFTFRWREEVRTEIAAVQRKGFGSRLLERIVPGYFSGTGTIDVQSSGLVYHMTGKLAPGE